MKNIKEGPAAFGEFNELASPVLSESIKKLLRLIALSCSIIVWGSLSGCESPQPVSWDAFQHDLKHAATPQSWREAMLKHIDLALDARDAYTPSHIDQQQWREHIKILRERLKEGITSQVAADQRLDEAEWKELHKAIPFETRKQTGMHDIANLRFMLMAEPFLRQAYHIPNNQLLKSYGGYVRTKVAGIDAFETTLAAVNPLTGELVWHRDEVRGELEPHIGKVDDIWSQHGLVEAERGMGRIDPLSGKVKWFNADLKGYKVELYTDKTWAVINNHTGSIAKIDPETGTVLWTKTLPPPVEHDGPVFFSNRTRAATAFDLATGTTLWEIHYPEDLGDIEAGFQGDILETGILTGEKGIMRIDPRNGQELWKIIGLEQKFPRGFQFNSEGYIFSSYNTRVLRIDMMTGNVLWENTAVPPPSSLDRFVKELRYRVESESAHEVAELDPATGKLLFTTKDISPEQVSKLAEFGITKISRFFSVDFVQHIIRNRELLREKKVKELTQKPLVLLSLAQADDGKPFDQNNYDKFMKYYNVLYFEIESETDLYKSWHQFLDLGLSVSKSVIGGHSIRTQMSFGSQDPALFEVQDETKMMDLSDRSELEPFAPVFENADVILLGCSAGEGKAAQENIGNLFSQTAGRSARSILSPTIPINGYFVFDPQGKYLHTVWLDEKGRQLQPAEYYLIQKKK